MGAPWKAISDGLQLSVRLTPRGGRDGIDGIETLSDNRPVLLARVRAVPEDGAANAALMALIAKACGVPKAKVALISGATSRIKTIGIKGEPDDLAEALRAAIGKEKRS